MEKELLRMSQETETRAELLSHEQIKDRLEKSAVVYMPLGALEFHGPHLPIGLDGLTAHGICLAAAAETGGVVLPTNYQGTGGEHSGYPWTLMMPSGDTLTANLLSMLERLQELRVETAVILSGHFALEQQEVLKVVSSEWASRKDSTMKVIAKAVSDAEGLAVSPDHAGQFESLLLSAIDSDLVHIDKLPDLELRPSVDPDGNPFGSHRHDPEHALWGVFGPDPRQSDLGLAQALLIGQARWLAGLVAKA
jgi:creatinine amidohydrolase